MYNDKTMYSSMKFIEGACQIIRRELNGKKNELQDIHDALIGIETELESYFREYENMNDKFRANLHVGERVYYGREAKIYIDGFDAGIQCVESSMKRLVEERRELLCKKSEVKDNER